jgi:ParB family chromosome partitioning protein
MNKSERMTIEAIDVGPRLRPVNEDVVATLMRSIQRLGQLQPISVFSPNDFTVILVAGAHRLEAMRRLGMEDIDVIFVTGDEVDRELCEIAENLHRAELTALERDVQIARWIELTAAMQTQVSSQVATKPQGGRPESGVRAASRELGIDKDDAQRAVKVASLSDEAKQAARDAGLDDNRAALLDAAKETTPEAQVAKLNQRTVDKQLKALTSAWEAAGDDARLRHLTAAWVDAGADVRARFLDQIGAAMIGAPADTAPTEQVRYS